MNSRLPKSRLGVELILYVLIAMLLSVFFFRGVGQLSRFILENYQDKSTYVQQRTRSTLDSLQGYIDANKLSLEELSSIDNWARGQESVFLLIYHDDRLIYDSRAIYDDKEFRKHAGWPPPPWRTYYDVKFSDATVQVDLMSFFEFQYKEYGLYISLTLTFIFFVLVFLFLLRRKTSYINRLEKEIKILEGGSLDCPITVKGRDELASLAESIDNMRLSFIERLENEEEARSSNLELVTAMSHDLRTPLTALIGYLDILEYEKYQGEEQLRQYIRSSRGKAYQLKELSDKLFDYFLAFQDGSRQPEMELIQGNTLLGQILSEYAFLLEDKGFQVELEQEECPFDLRVEAASIQRTFDNLFSNIIKYADPAEKVQIRYRLEGTLLRVSLENARNRSVSEVESSGIGLKTCRRILRQHNGELTVTEERDSYRVQLWLPLAVPVSRA